jgi:CDP-4-dehydro-6-deoxyglucose reductase
MPYGDFVVSGDHDAVIIAGGTGITAFTAFLQAIGSKNRVWLYYGVRDRSLLIYKDLIQQIVKNHDNLRAYYYLENVGDLATNERHSILLIQDIINDLPDISIPVYYLAGPPAMVSKFRSELAELGVTSSQVKVDAWE